MGVCLWKVVALTQHLQLDGEYDMAPKVPWVTERAIRARYATHLTLATGTPMTTPTLTVNVEALIGLTAWKSAAFEPPPTTGWWRTRKATSPLLLQPQRRWWDGRNFSLPVLVNFDDEDEAEQLLVCPALIPPINIEWCGLKEPHPSGYSYKPIKFW